MKKVIMLFAVVILATGLLVSPIGATSEVQVSVAAPAQVPAGSDFVARVNIGEVTNLFAAQYVVSFDTTVLRLDNVTAGVVGGVTFPVSEYNPDNYTVVQYLAGGVSGSGYLAELHFHVIGTDGDSSHINLTQGMLANTGAQQIPATWTGTTVQIGVATHWTVPMTATAGAEGSNSDLEFGIYPDATDGYDSGIDVPHPPPGPTPPPFKAYFSIVSMLFPELNKDFRGETPNTWTLKVKSTGQNIQLTWDASGIPAGLWAIMDTGTQKIDMKAQDSVPLPAGDYTISISVSETRPIELHLKAGWNLVSVPVVPADTSVASVFPGTEVVYAWNAATKKYYTPTQVEGWRGYWVAVMSDTVITVRGVPVYSWSADMIAGWNLIGSVYQSADFTAPDTNPPGKVEPFCYRWVPGTGYIHGTTIEPGKGYWIAATQDCELIL